MHLNWREARHAATGCSRYWRSWIRKLTLSGGKGCGSLGRTTSRISIRSRWLLGPLVLMGLLIPAPVSAEDTQVSVTVEPVLSLQIVAVTSSAVQLAVSSNLPSGWSLSASSTAPLTLGGEDGTSVTLTNTALGSRELTLGVASNPDVAPSVTLNLVPLY